MPERRTKKAGARPAEREKAAAKPPRRVDEQVLALLREAEAGAKVEELCSGHGIASETLAKWSAEQGSTGEAVAQCLRRLEDENRRLRTIVVELTLSNQALKLAISKKW